MRQRLIPNLLFCVLFTAACAAQAKGSPGSAGGIKWTAPAGWKDQGSRQMRAATYEVPAAQGDKEAGECAVFFFGAGQGGGVQANIDRWIKQFSPADAKPKTAESTINGLKVTTVEASGTYQSGGPMGPSVAKSGYRMIASVVEGKQSNVFFKLTGPAKTVAARAADYQALLKSLKTE